jgi:FtsH-binding integral membrane protein
MWDTLSVFLLAFAAFLATEFLGIFNKLNFFLTIVVSFGSAFFLFQFLKRKVVHFCTAKLSDTCVIFEFENETKTINFSELTSYKSYYGKNGPILYLNNNVEKFKIFANNNFCDSDDFKTFSDDAIIQLNKYKDKNNLTLIHEGSMYATKGFLYFLFIATSIYFLSFTLESKDLRPYIGIGGGVYLLISWIAYFNKRDLKSK